MFSMPVETTAALRALLLGNAKSPPNIAFGAGIGLDCGAPVPTGMLFAGTPPTPGGIAGACGPVTPPASGATAAVLCCGAPASCGGRPDLLLYKLKKAFCGSPRPGGTSSLNTHLNSLDCR